MNLAVVVQRYGADIGGGAELHARYIAEHLSSHAQVTVLTTCARDYVTWRNEMPPGEDRVNGVKVERYPVAHERDTRDFARRSARVFTETHSLHDELKWLDSEGPASRSLIARLRKSREEFDFVLLFSARYYQAFHGARAVPERAVLVPTAEREPSLGMAAFQPVFRGVRAVMYNSPEEQALINSLSNNSATPGAVVGVGSEIPDAVEPQRARQRFQLTRPFVIYVGRIDANKGCAELFDYFLSYLDTSGRHLDLVLVGAPVLPIPQHPRIRHLGFVSDEDKFDLIAGAEALLMPSYYESLSMVTLEAWALGRPVLVNAHCDVLLGQSVRSNAGLFYENRLEFGAALDALLDTPRLATRLGQNGREYYSRHYGWPVIERTYLDMFTRLAAEPLSHRMEPIPGLMARRRNNLPPSAAIVDAAPKGAVVIRRTREEVSR